MSEIVDPAHTLGPPLIVPGVGKGFTVIIEYAKAVVQLLVTVYLMESTPGATGVTKPLVLIEATAGVLLLQVPPLADSIRVTEVPIQKLVGPVIVPTVGNGDALTVTV